MRRQIEVSTRGQEERLGGFNRRPGDQELIKIKPNFLLIS
jgi:hypothetical protein